MAQYHQVDLDTIKKINALASAGEMTSTKLSELASVVMVLAEGFLKFIPVDECSLFAAKVPDGYYSPNGVKLGDNDVQI